MPYKLIACISLPPASILSIPIYDFAVANEKLATLETEHYYSCCRKSICGGCLDSFRKSGNNEKCAFCKAYVRGKTDDKQVEELMKRVDVNDASAIYLLGYLYKEGVRSKRCSAGLCKSNRTVYKGNRSRI
jgi:hypothetical protein